MTRKDRKSRYTCSVEHARRLYLLWEGAGGHLSKVDIERKFFGDWTSQAKGITLLWREVLGIETEEKSSLHKRVIELEARVTELELRLSAARI